MRPQQPRGLMLGADRRVLERILEMARARSLILSLLCSGLVLVLAALSGISPILAASQTSFRIVVHPGVPDSVLARQDLSDVFLKKRTTWSDGSAVHPVTLGNRDVDRAFSEAIHRRSSAALKKFWQRQIFTGGGTPPPNRPTDTAVLEYVRSTPGAIGVVSTQISLASAGVRVLDVR